MRHMPLVANAHHYLRKGGGCTYHMFTICVYVYVDVNRRIICDTCPSLPAPNITFVKETCALGHANACVCMYVGVDRFIICDTRPSLPAPTITFVTESPWPPPHALNATTHVHTFKIHQLTNHTGLSIDFHVGTALVSFAFTHGT